MMLNSITRSKLSVGGIKPLRFVLFIGAAIMLQACQQAATSDAETRMLTTDARAESPGFILWRASELAQRNAQLGTTIGADGSSRETLADYLTPARSHRFRFIRRDSDGLPEQHDEIEDYVYVQSGQGTILVGGQMLGRTGDMGTEINGGTRYSVGAGDVLRIPAGIPHAYLVGDGGHITYVLVRVPAFRGVIVANPDGPAPALDPPGFGLWRAAELEQRNTALIARVRTDGSSRETLADYGVGGNSHRIRFLRRNRDGWPELHEDIIDVVFIQSGEGTVQVGGEMIGGSNVPGSTINGGLQFPVAAGDVLHIPAKTPHAYLANRGDHITYVLMRVPAVSLH
jgi:mannose-6-phosphate isomerase-like protein (cupin superfamily)